MSQELARRCLWIQHGAAESKATPAPSVVEQENRRRVAATQKALKVCRENTLHLIFTV